MKILLYYHAGSKNHGCEAIVRTLRNLFPQDEMILYSFDAKSDRQYGLDKIVSVKQCERRKVQYSLIERIRIRLHLYQEGQECYCTMLEEKGVDWAFAIGGDNYCYKGQPEEMAYINREFKKRNVKTALVGCSIDEEVINRRPVQEDLARYNVIVARESLTYEALKRIRLNNVVLYPDTAFLLGTKEPEERNLRNDIEYMGINVSPLVIKNESKKNIVYYNYVKLMEYILKNTKYHILLIPHVCVEWDNDLDTLNWLYKEFGQDDRVRIVAESNSEVLKYYVSKCSFIVCARTHVSIAAYSLGIPTLVVGYSIKSRGIAKDLFGNYKEFVLAAADIISQNSILDQFVLLLDRQKEIRNQLQNKVKEIRLELEHLKDIFANQ